MLEREPHVLLGANASLFDDDRKRRLTEKVIDRYRQREHLDRDPFQRPAFHNLAFGGLGDLLAPVIRDGREQLRDAWCGVRNRARLQGGSAKRAPRKSKASVGKAKPTRASSALRERPSKRQKVGPSARRRGAK